MLGLDLSLVYQIGVSRLGIESWGSDFSLARLGLEPRNLVLNLEARVCQPKGRDLDFEKFSVTALFEEEISYL